MSAEKGRGEGRDSERKIEGEQTRSGKATKNSSHA